MARSVIEEAPKLVSVIFNAPIMASVAFLLLLVFGEGLDLLVSIIAVIFGTVLPLSFIYYLSKLRMIPDFHVSRKESRGVPFLGAIFSYLLGSICLGLLKAPIIVTALMLCYLGNSVIMMAISTKWKISIHASGITGPATVLLYSFGWVALSMFLLVIPVGWARIRTGAHTMNQFLAGALLTIPMTWVQLLLYLRFLYYTNG